jgi:hypothetical protein
MLGLAGGGENNLPTSFHFLSLKRHRGLSACGAIFSVVNAAIICYF